jgi:hypothetical protein
MFSASGTVHRQQAERYGRTTRDMRMKLLRPIELYEFTHSLDDFLDCCIEENVA